MDKLQQLRTLVRKRHDENWEKRNNDYGGDLYWERALEDAKILAIIDSIPRFKIGDVIKSGSYIYTIKDMDEDSYILEGDRVLTFNAQYDWELVEEPQRIVSSEANEAEYANKDFTFKSIPRILEMVKPSERAKSYCEKLAKSLEDEGYLTDAKIVMESVKVMNGEKVPMATIDKCFILKQNNKEIRKRIEDAGIHVCVCASFKLACWLDYHTTVANGVHGVGYFDDELNIHSQEEELARFMSEVRNPFVCKDVDEFINLIKEFENGKTE